MLEDWMGKENFRDGCRVSETALAIYFIPFLLLYLCVGVFFGFSFSEIFERFLLQECQNGQLLGISHRCTLGHASFYCHLKFNCNLLFIHVQTYKQAHVFAHAYIVCVHHACVYVYVCKVLCVRPVVRFCLQVSGLPVADVMDTWTKQMGYPVLDLSISETSANLSQKHFLLDPKADTKNITSPFELVIQKHLAFFSMWWIPLSKIWFASRYKWTIPVKWHALKSEKTVTTMFAKDKGKMLRTVFTPMLFEIIKEKKKAQPFDHSSSHATHRAVKSLINMWQKANWLWNKGQTFLFL